MDKKLASLFTILFFSHLGYAADSNQANPSNEQKVNQEEDYSESQIAQGSNSPGNDARWYKNRAGRREYLKGGTDYPGIDREAEHHQVSPSNARSNKSRAGRQEYLKGEGN